MSASTDLKPRNLWKILFGISLAFNLLIVGALGGAMLRVGKGPVVKHRASGNLYMRALNSEDKKALRKELFKNKDSRKVIRAKEHSSYSSAVKILRKYPFDRKALEDLLDQQTKYLKSRPSSARAVLITQIENMTKEERLIYSKRLEDLIRNNLK
ncbi:periplasmic heavy metal sensor [Paracoccaceae bacterium]|nr:periplasmic heavy metal sensor [Paracoccaceae bacterium]